MFVKRNIRLSDGDRLVNATLIKSEDLDACLTAKNIRADAKNKALAVIDKAKRYAAEIIRESRREARELVEQERQRAYREVWDCVNQHLQAWQQQQEAMWQAIEEHAGNIVTKVLESISLELDDSKRVQLLLKPLIESQKTPLKAMLRCSPELQAEVGRQIGEKGIDYWTIKTDPSMPKDTLVVESPQGTFSISWASLLQNI